MLKRRGFRTHPVAPDPTNRGRRGREAEALRFGKGSRFAGTDIDGRHLFSCPYEIYQTFFITILTFRQRKNATQTLE